MGLMGNRRVLLSGSALPVPSLDLDFLAGTMPAGITFTRASTAWAYNSSGVLASAATNTPRFDYDPSTLTARGLLIEEARTNLVPGALSNTTYYSVNAVTTASGAAAPDGTAAAVTVTGNAGGTTNYGLNVAAASLATITPSVPTTASVFVKAGTAAYFRLILTDNNTPTIGAQAYVNMATGALGTVSTQAGAPTAISATVQTLPGGWYRVALTATLGAATTASILLRMTSANGTTTDTGSNTLVLYAPQLESNAAFASSPILTTTAAVTRAADVASISPLGSWFNAAEGALFMEATRYTIRSSTSYVILSDGTSNNTMGHVNGVGTPGQQRSDVVVGGVNQAQFSYTSAATADTIYREALAYKLNDFAGCMNGGAIFTDISGTVPTVDRVNIGTNASVSTWLAGHIRKIKVYNRRLADATLQRLTS